MQVFCAHNICPGVMMLHQELRGAGAHGARSGTGMIVAGAAVILAMFAQNLLRSPSDARAQGAVIQIPYAPACRDCRIVSDTVVIIGGEQYGDSIRLGGGLARDSRGFYYTVAAGEIGVAVFDSTGKYLRRFGRSGQGPGEFSSPIRRILIGAADTLFVLQVRTVHVFSPAHVFVRSFQLPNSVADLEALRGGQFVFGGSTVVRGSGGEPFHLLDASGKVLRSFGAARPVTAMDEGFQAYANFTMGDDGGSLWHTVSGSSRLDSWGLNGALLRSYEITGIPDWRNAADPSARKLDQKAAQALMSDRSQAAQGRLASMLGPSASRLQLTRVDARHHAWITAMSGSGMRLLVVDLAGRRVLAFLQRSQTTVRVPGTNLAYSYQQRDDGRVAIIVEHMRVAGGGY